MDHRQLLADAAQRPVDTARTVLDGITPEALHAMPERRGNSIAWLVWHAARQMDAQLADLVQEEQVWVRGGWADKLGVERGPHSFGFGDDSGAVGELRVTDPDALRDYLTAVVDALVAYTDTLSEEDLDVVVDDSWDPPTTRGVRIISLIDDAVAHLGQAAYARGLVEGWRIGY